MKDDEVSTLGETFAAPKEPINMFEVEYFLDTQEPTSDMMEDIFVSNPTKELRTDW